MIRRTLLNSGWQFAERSWLEGLKPTYGSLPGWLPAEIPGHVHLDLHRNGIIADPLTAMHEVGCQWVDERDWSYRCAFDWQPDPENPSRVLRFDGLDTVCTVCTIWLNGEQIGASDNMFLPLEIDVTERLLEGANELRIDFESAARVGRERRAVYFEKHGLKPETVNFDERAFVRKAQYMFGWDWGPRLASCGIWRPVELIDGTTTRVETSATRCSLVDLVRQPDEFGESFEFHVNGKPLWIRGANWIPIHSFPSQTQNLRDRLEAAAKMGMNMLRVWGGGVYESDEFYDLCDELGILVWQDFPFACSYYPDDDEHLKGVEAEAIANIKRLRHHPCLALWCGNNENQTMWEGAWGGKENQPTRQIGEKIWYELLPRLVAEHDPERPYIPTSPTGLNPAKPREGCNAGGFGDQHLWDAWHGRGDWVHYGESMARFCSEFGFASSPSMEVWRHALGDSEARLLGYSDGPKSADGERVVANDPPPTESGHSPLTIHDLPLSHPIVRWHDKTNKGWDNYLDLIALHYPRPTNLEELVYYSQLNQRDAMRYAIEHLRRSEFCRGALIWQLNDCWPAQSWALVDSAGNWKAAAYDLKQIYAPTFASIVVDGSQLQVWYVNDDHKEAEDFVRLELFDTLTGEALHLGTETKFTATAGSRGVVLTHDLSPFDRRRTMAHVFSLSNESARLLCEPKDVLLALPKIKAKIIEPGRLEIAVAGLVVDLFFEDVKGTARFTDNFYTFEGSARPRSCNFTGEIGELRARSLAGIHEIVLERQAPEPN